MFRLFLICLLLTGSSAFAQYGKLEPLSETDTLHKVMRTPKVTLEKLSADKNKETRHLASLITAIERQLEFARAGYLVNRTPTINVQSFTSNIRMLERKQVETENYLQEFFLYYRGR
ncbi:hypothetical protein [Hufsiella ginkgonis]|uniref:Uncharacterized protein n=1 Tax=Hufsiella ginkgonis TaxID=2695274 RepID=A0A7K1XZP6_9SPHI|nr:hypothetical protein [Hufsiella ginkgonis]MXV16278.1 hypothetical protein [Hufsiella ginkgonis]